MTATTVTPPTDAVPEPDTRTSTGAGGYVSPH